MVGAVLGVAAAWTRSTRVVWVSHKGRWRLCLKKRFRLIWNTDDPARTAIRYHCPALCERSHPCANVALMKCYEQNFILNSDDPDAAMTTVRQFREMQRLAKGSLEAWLDKAMTVILCVSIASMFVVLVLLADHFSSVVVGGSS